MSNFLSPEELEVLRPAESSSFAGPIPTQIVSSDEFFPLRQNQQQREVEALLKEMGTRLASKQGISRRSFFRTAAGMAAAFLAMNQVYGKVFEVTSAEARTPEMASERAAAPARLYDYRPPVSWSKMDRFAVLKQEYLQSRPRPTNLRYGYVLV